MMRNRRRLFPQRLIRPARLGSSTWLLRLRSFAVVGQLSTIIAAWLLTDLPLAYRSLLAAVGLTALTNLGYAIWLGRTAAARPAGTDANATGEDGWWAETEPNDTGVTAALLMLLDLIVLTAMLYGSGGVDNPFSFFYFVNLAVAGVMLRPARAWSLAITAILGYALLLMTAPQVRGISLSGHSPGDWTRALGLMLAFTTCASVVTYFVTRTSGELRQRERELSRAQAARAADRQLEGLTTLAAGAAHELATPLSTIDVIVRELMRHLEGVKKPASVDQDLKLIDGQLDMCRQILQRMRSAAGDSMAQRWDHTTVGDLIDTTLEGIRDPHRVDVIDAAAEIECRELWLPQEAVAQAVRNLVHNGLDACGPAGRVTLEPRIDGECLRILVSDGGSGMEASVLDRLGTPFFTTKEPGRGIGLGLFLTRNVVSQLGGTLEFESAPQRGTRATVTLPLDAHGRDEADHAGTTGPAIPTGPAAPPDAATRV